MPKRKLDLTSALIGALALFVVGAVILGTRPAWLMNFLEARRRASEGWSLVTEGDFKPLTLQPAKLGEISPEHIKLGFTGSYHPETASVMYFSCSQVFPMGDVFYGETQGKLKTYAKLVTPKGSYLLLNLERSSNSPSFYCVAIPAVQPNNVAYMELHIVPEGGKETVVRLDRPPQSEELVPQDAADQKSVRDGDIEIKGEAFAATRKRSKEQVGIACRIEWSKLPKTLSWRATLQSGGLRPYGQKSLTGGSSSVDAAQTQSIGIIEAVPFAPEIEKVKAQGRLDGYDIQDEVVDFGTFKAFLDPKLASMHSQPCYGVDVSKPITKRLANGLQLTLVPFRDFDKLHSFIGDSAIYFRLHPEPATLSQGIQNPPILGEPPRVEIKLLGVNDYFSQISSGMGATADYPDMQMLQWKPGADKSIHLKFSVRRMVLRRRVPFELLLPVDRTKSRASSTAAHTLFSGSEFFD